MGARPNVPWCASTRCSGSENAFRKVRTCTCFRSSALLDGLPSLRWYRSARSRNKISSLNSLMGCRQKKERERELSLICPSHFEGCEIKKKEEKKLQHVHNVNSGGGGWKKGEKEKLEQRESAKERLCEQQQMVADREEKQL